MKRYAGAVREHLNLIFGDDWSGRGAPKWEWPPRSPDLTPCDFFLWGLIKELVYFVEITDIEQLRRRIIEAFNQVRNDEAMIRRATESAYSRMLLCAANNGEKFENFK